MEPVRVVCTFISPSGEKIEAIRLPITDPAITVRRAAMDALLRFSKSRMHRGATPLAVTEVTVEGECVLYYGDKLLDAVDIAKEKLFLRLNVDVSTAEKRAVAYVARAVGTTEPAAPLRENPGPQAAALAPMLPRCGTRGDRAPVQSSCSPLETTEPSMDLVAPLAPPLPRRTLRGTHRGGSGLYLTKEQLRTPRRQRSTRSRSPQPTPVSLHGEGERLTMPHISDIPCPATQHEHQQLKQSQPRRRSPAQRKAKADDVDTPDAAKLVAVEEKLEAEQARGSGLGWTSTSHELFPTNYVADPDAIARELRKRKRAEGKADSKASKTVSAKAAVAPTAAGPATGGAAGAAPAVTSGSCHRNPIIVEEAEGQVTSKAQRREPADAAHTPPEVSRSLFGEMSVAQIGDIAVGSLVDARLNGRVWYPAVVIAIDTAMCLFTVRWDSSSTGSGSSDLVSRKDVRLRRPKAGAASSSKVASSSGNFHSNGTCVTPAQQQQPMPMSQLSPTTDAPVVPGVSASQAGGGLGWGAGASDFFDPRTYTSNPSKAHLYLDKSVLEAPRSKRNATQTGLYRSPVFSSGLL